MHIFRATTIFHMQNIFYCILMKNAIFSDFKILNVYSSKISNIVLKFKTTCQLFLNIERDKQYFSKKNFGGLISHGMTHMQMIFILSYQI